MHHLTRTGALTLISAAALASAWAAGSSGARMLPDPPGVRSIYAPGPPAGAAVAETWVRTGAGLVRVRKDGSDTPSPSFADPPGTVTTWGPDHQAVRVVPGVLPDGSAAAVPPLPAGAIVLESGGAKMLRLPGVLDGLEAPAPAASLPPGMRIVDLPPGAVAPVGMPEPMTLYRVTTAPQTTPAAR